MSAQPSVLCALLLALPLSAQPAHPSAPRAAATASHPLLEYAREQERERTRARTRVVIGDADLREARHQIEQAQVPDDTQCAASIGAARYAELHLRLGATHASLGEQLAAATAYRRAHACRPRDAGILAALAGVLFDARDFTGARQAVEASLAIDPRSVSSNRLAGNLEFVEEHWANAAARFRYVAASDDDRVQAGYGQLMYWLAQRRAGVEQPQWVARTPGEGWPQPLLLYMRGEYTEAELLAPIGAGDLPSNSQPNTRSDERLCEALFYVGEEYWARGQPGVALDYFAALVNIKVLYFLEHGLARAEIAKLQATE